MVFDWPEVTSRHASRPAALIRATTWFVRIVCDLTCVYFHPVPSTFEISLSLSLFVFLHLSLDDRWDRIIIIIIIIRIVGWCCFWSWTIAFNLAARCTGQLGSKVFRNACLDLLIDTGITVLRAEVVQPGWSRGSSRNVSVLCFFFFFNWMISFTVILVN